MRKFFLISLAVVSIVSGILFVSAETTKPQVATASPSPTMTASVFQAQATPHTLEQRFNDTLTTGQKIKILIVPGHEPDLGGAEYKNLKERDMAVDLANELYGYLSKDPHYDVALTRNKDGWNPTLAAYFNEHWADIQSFIANKKSEMAHLVDTGQVVPINNKIYHNAAPDEVATRLYGINKWADEQGVDIVLHLHFNDSGSHRINKPDEYSGIAVYIPEHQFPNAVPSTAIGQKIFARLSRFSATSNLPQEDRGLIEDQNLIALGSKNTLKSASVLVEYGYIYEPQFLNTETRSTATRELAYQTYLGLSDFFGETASITKPYASTILPHVWKQVVTKSRTPHKEVLATQTALTLEGLYPPPGHTKNDCPINGVFGTCTQLALKDFQNRFHIPGNGNIIGQKTRAKLNELYGK